MTFWVAVLTSMGLFTLGGIAAGWLELRLRLISVAHAAVLGTGAYSYALLTKGEVTAGLALLLAAGCGGIAGVLLVGASQRVVREDFALFSFALQVAWLGFVANARDWTGGPLGIAGIERLPLQVALGRPGGALAWILILLIGIGSLLFLERRGWFPVAAAVVARSRELAETIGLSARGIRLQIGTLYGLVLGAAGAVLASWVSFIGPELFSVWTSVVLLALGFLAAWRWWGAALGVIVLIGIPEVLRTTGFSSAELAFVRQLLAGLAVAVAALVLLRPGDR